MIGVVVHSHAGYDIGKGATLIGHRVAASQSSKQVQDGGLRNFHEPGRREIFLGFGKRERGTIGG